MRYLLAACGLLLAAACGTSTPSEPRSPEATRTGSASPDFSEPEQAVADLMHALDEGDCPVARKLVLTPSELTCDIVEEAKGSFADEGIDLDETTFRAGPVHDRSTTVTIRWGNDYPPESYDLQRVRDRWKVVFDSAA